MKVLVTGGSGYLGQFIVHSLASSGAHEVAFTFLRPNPHFGHDESVGLLGGARSFQADTSTGVGLDVVLRGMGLPDVVVNCAAMSVPRDCEKDPIAADAVNVPRPLLDWMESIASKRKGEEAVRGGGGVGSYESGRQPLLIHLSTDQVYSGLKRFSSEDDPPAPVNIYGTTKVAAEKEISRRCSNFAILRSSIIVGPQPPIPLNKSLPLLWMDRVLASGQVTDFFSDEFRCPVFVLDIVHIVERIIERFGAAQQQLQKEPLRLLLNVGGPDRLSRAGMAEALARVRGYGEWRVEGGGEGGEGSGGDPCSLIRRVAASTAINRGVPSPSDISMDISRLCSVLSFSPTPYVDAVKQTFDIK